MKICVEECKPGHHYAPQLANGSTSPKIQKWIKRIFFSKLNWPILSSRRVMTCLLSLFQKNLTVSGKHEMEINEID